MDAVVERFNDKVKEIDLYFKLLRELDDPDARICRRRRKKVHPTSFKVMKATAFLLVYNMVESTIRGAFSALYKRVASEGRTYRQLREELRRVWIRQKYRGKFGGDGDKENEEGARPSSYLEVTEDIADQILRGLAVDLEADKLNLAGNLDARKVRQLCRFHGLKLRVHHRAFGGSELKTVKDHRNALGHGHVTFSECGGQYTVGDLERIKARSIVFMRSFLRGLGTYVDDAHYIHVEAPLGPRDEFPAGDASPATA